MNYKHKIQWITQGENSGVQTPFLKDSELYFKVKYFLKDTNLLGRKTCDRSVVIIKKIQIQQMQFIHLSRNCRKTTYNGNFNKRL